MGRKLNMSVRFDQWGRRRPVTEIALSPGVVLNKRTVQKDGYKAYQIGFESTKHANKPLEGFLKKQKITTNPGVICEIKTDEELNIGQTFGADIFEVGDEVKVTGTSKGRGFAGVVKRYGFAGGPKTHGQSDRERAPGSIGSTTTPGRVYKGKRMAGHMGVEKVTVKGLEIVEIQKDKKDKKDKNLLVVSGAIPGPRGGLVMITKTGKVKGWTPPLEPPAPKEPEEAEETKGSNETNETNKTNKVEIKEETNAKENAGA